MPQNLHTIEIIEELERLFETNLKTALSLKTVIKSGLEFEPFQALADRVPCIFIKPEKDTDFEFIHVGQSYQVTYRFRVIYVRSIVQNSEVWKQKVNDAEQIVQELIDNIQLSALTLTDGQVLWTIPRRIEWEPPEDAFVAEINADLVAVAIEYEAVVKTKR